LSPRNPFIVTYSLSHVLDLLDALSFYGSPGLVDNTGLLSRFGTTLWIVIKPATAGVLRALLIIVWRANTGRRFSGIRWRTIGKNAERELGRELSAH
jgi:hypothetical protein